jgi:hypothetical protein
MKKKRTFAYLGTHEIGKTTVAVEVIKCGLSNVMESVCSHDIKYQGKDEDGFEICTKCGMKF